MYIIAALLLWEIIILGRYDLSFPERLLLEYESFIRGSTVAT